MLFGAKQTIIIVGSPVEMLKSGQHSHEVQGLLNRQPLFVYKDNKCHTIGAHRNSMNVTKICEKEVDTLKDGIDNFKGLLLHILQETNTIRSKFQMAQ